MIKFCLGDFWQLPPVMDRMVFDKNNLDKRPASAQSHWDENFRIFYLTEKMRCKNDESFSILCDNVARGRISEDDMKYLKSRVQPTEAEHENENYKSGKLCIIVTTNPMRTHINQEKLEQLLPYEKEYSCDSVDRVTNLPAGRKIPQRLKGNLGKTGNLETELKLKVNAPVVITNNHSKGKYREDGIMNGARGYVQSIQVSREDPEKVDVIWIVFKQDTIGKLYRFEHSHLLKHHNPGHKLATPILPTRRTFTEKFGEVEYQRTNFPLSLAYALTAHKCQGETLETVIIDFGEDLERKIKNFICAGSFYVALTRVKTGSSVFLKSFDSSYIQVNRRIEEKVNAMRKFKPYLFKKIYINEKIFESKEIKVGYLNINGLCEGNHALYLNSDHNLGHLDILVLAETKLIESNCSKDVENLLDNWTLLGRYDSKDGKKHMGLLLLCKLNSSISGEISSMIHEVVKRDGNLQIQGLIVRLKNGFNLGFIYCRSNPFFSEIKAINKYFEECTAIMGDFNLSHRNEEDQKKIISLCQETRFSALNEITRSISINQLDYILLDTSFKKSSFVASYHNFISDHKTITLRFNMNGCKLMESILERITFDQESHLKSKTNVMLEDSDTDELNTGRIESEKSESDVDNDMISPRPSTENQIFRRRFKNPDMATCWLNSCLQLLLCAMDQKKDEEFNSELGTELKNLQTNQSQDCLDPTIVKDIIVTCEDTRIATRLSEISQDMNKEEMERQIRRIQSCRLDLRAGQQCVRDFFVALQENLVNWPDIYCFFAFQVVNSTKCLNCSKISASEATMMYEELEVPSDESSLRIGIEQFFNGAEIVDHHCNEGCKKHGYGEKRTTLKSIKDTKFIILILKRAVFSETGIHLAENNVLCTEPAEIRYLVWKRKFLLKISF